MKNTWNILFVLFLLFETACNSPSQSIKNTDLVAEDSICFPIDEHTYYASKSIFQFEENGHEYLSFLDAEYSQKINIYDIKNQKLIKTILLQKEGPNGMNVLSGCHPLNLNHFIITSWNGTFWLSGNFWLVSFKISYLCLPLFYETRTTPSCHPSGCAYRQL